LGKYRDRLQIVADILSIVSNGAKKTQIMYQANLSYKLLCRYLSEVVKAELICLKNSDCFMLTKKGQDFLVRHREYSKRRKRVEEHLNNVEDERALLMMMCSHSGLSYAEEIDGFNQRTLNRKQKM